MITLKEASLTPAQRLFAEHLSIPISKTGCSLHIERGDALRVVKKGGSIRIVYSKPCEVFSGLTLLSEYSGAKEEIHLMQKARFESLAVSCDCSRNAVLTVDALKTFIMNMAALGYNQIQLYTEDTFEVKEYPYFGYLRGRYTKEEIQEVDQFAVMFGVELVPCVQTLAHLASVFRWPQFNQIHDVNDILLCEEEKTYVFLDCMIHSLREMYTTDKIHIGMDEAHMLGLGVYLQKHGFQDRMELLLRHLNRVIEIVNKYGFKPMMWSDMFFKLAAGKLDYSDIKAAGFDKAVLDMIPAEVSLVYWDYTNKPVEKYLDLLTAHEKMNREVIFAGGARKWTGFCPDMYYSMLASRNALAALAQSGVSKVLVTTWGDNGAEGSLYLAMPVLALYSEICYTGDESDEAVNRKLKTLFGYTLEDFLELEAPDRMPERNGEVISLGSTTSKALLWNDPLVGIFDRHVLVGYNRIYAQTAEKLDTLRKKSLPVSYIFDTIYHLCSYLSYKAEFGILLRTAYQNGDKTALTQLTDQIPVMVQKLDYFHRAFRKNWLKENKTFGFDVQDIRFGAQRARLVYTQEVLCEYLYGKTENIPELEKTIMYADCREESSEAPVNIVYNNWEGIATANVMH